MKRLLFKLASPALKLFIPGRFKEWFPFASKVIGLILVGTVGVQNPELAEQLLGLLKTTLGSDEAFLALAAGLIPGIYKLSADLVHDFQAARGNPSSKGPVVQTLEGHGVYEEEFFTQLKSAGDSEKAYADAAKKATKKARDFEQDFRVALHQLTNEEGVPANDAATRARNIAYSKIVR